MSTQSGIVASKQLIESFKEFTTSNSRALFISIENETLVPKELIKGNNDKNQDILEIQTHLSDSKVTYLIVKNFESTKNSSSSYYFISYVPDPAPVREKMLYASSKNTLLRELGLEYFTSVLFINDSEELSVEGWEKIQQTESASKPLSESEQELRKVKELEITEGSSSKRRGLVSVTSGSSTSAGLLKFKISDDKLSSIINDGSINSNEIYTILIDSTNESFYLKTTSKFDNVSEIPSLLLTSEPNFNILNHDSLNYFIYSCPSGSKVKSRMAYAANKQSLISEFTSKGFQFKKIIEVGDSDEIELSVFNSEITSNNSNKLSSTSSDSSQASTTGGLKFSKPKGPRRR